MQQEYDWVVVGEGIGGQAACLEICTRYPKDSVLQLSLPAFPTLRHELIPLIAQDGFEKGLSPLGDLYLNALNYFPDWVESRQVKGVHELTHFIQGDQQRYQKLRRNDDFFKGQSFFQGKAYTFDLPLFSLWSKQQTQNLQKVNDCLCSWEDKGSQVVLYGSKNNYLGKRAIFACGAYRNLAQEQKLEIKKGSFWSTESEFKGEDFVVSLKGVNLIKLGQKLMLGSSQNISGFDFFPSKSELSSLHSLFSKKLSGKLSLPPFEKGQVYTGLRLKGQRRTPFLTWHSAKVVEMGAFYKNGYLWGPYFSKLILDEFHDKMNSMEPL